ncbi:5,10-methylenetetrahydrofolate reductase [Pseudobythopirellula maris]|uniref:Methylenetetrahydrofolate reductase n=1 Tax=Pseudobythopirellula maris TaxID=2527991 RepID=A0A5C5ZGK5_9BACT|nr:methylenetetrahydrofolate reductase [NAD(P)H] [Pseudobythopirellula maris]TWT86260.1 5,10-methylenetetrahydrofolate reductase [Pseudobythopirellula maris]
MRISEAYGAGKFGVSFELFPPKTPEGERALYGHVERLMAYRPSYITCTYGAGGSTQDKTLEIIARVRKEFGVSVATHLTCVGRTADQLRDYLARAESMGVENVVALRGDPPKGDDTFRAIEGGYRYANELVTMIRQDFPGLGVAVAGYPEVHQEATDPKVDLENLKRKVDSGGEVVITQLFYDNADYLRFRDLCQAAGLTAPIVPGLLPVTNLAQIKRITSLCGARLPEEMTAPLEAAGDDADAQFAAGVEYAARQAQELIDAGAPGVHFYVLNKSQATSRVLDSVSLPATTMG